MNKALDERIKSVLFRYMNLVFNISESSDIRYILQIVNANDFFYEIIKGIEKISRFKKAKFYTIDLDFEDLGMSEIDERGKYILPEWLKEKESSVILVYNLDNLSKKNYKLKQLKEIIKKGTIQKIKIPSNKHFILLSNKEDLGSRETIIRIDIKKALNIINKEKRYVS